MFGHRREFEPGDNGLSEASGITNLSQWQYTAVFVTIFAGNAICALIYDVLPPILPEFVQHYGGGPTGELIAQLASTAPLGGVMVAGLIAGPVIERLGIRSTLILCLIMFGSFGSVGYMLNSASLMLATRFVMGISVGVSLTACTWLVSAHYTGTGRAAMTGRLTTIGCISSIVFIYASGFLASALSWRAPFLLHGILALVFIWPILTIIEQARPPRHKGSALRSLAQLGPVMPAYFIAIAYFIVNNLYIVQLVFVMDSAGAASPMKTTIVFSMFSIIIAIISAQYGRIEIRLGIAKALRLAFTLLALSLIIAFFADRMWHFCVTMALGGIGTGIILPSAWNLVMKLSPQGLTARALGLMTTACYFSAAFAPAIIFPLRLTVGLRHEYLVVAALIMIALLIQYALRAKATNPQQAV